MHRYPVPIPTPIEARLVQVGQPTHGGVLVVGLAGATTAGGVVAEDGAGKALAFGRANAAGGFSLLLDAGSTSGGVRLRPLVDGLPQGTALVVPSPAANGRPPPQAQVGAPDPSGLVSIQIVAQAGEHPVVAVPSTAEVASSTTSFDVTLHAPAGAAIYVFAVDDAGRSSEHRVQIVSATPPACADADGDTYGARGSDLSACAGSSSIADCEDGVAGAHPGQLQVFTAPIPGAPPGLAFDYSCDGNEQLEHGALVSCDASCVGEGWQGSVPACGKEGSWVRCTFLKTGCTQQSQGTRLQGCR